MKKLTVICLSLLILGSFKVDGQEQAAANGKSAKVNGLKLYYEESGKGMPLILLHGFFGTTSQWKSYIPEFSKTMRVIAVDLPGHGRSDCMDTTKVYLHKRAAEYIIGLIDFLKLDSVNVMGISSGGFITLYMVTLRPGLVKNIVVIGGQVYYSAQTRRLISERGNIGPDQTAIAAHGKEKATLISRQFYNFRKLYNDPSFTPDVLATIRARSLIIHGDNDPIAPVSNALAMHNDISNSYLWIVPNGGHVPSLIPANQTDFIRRVSEFFNKEWEKK